MKPQPSSTVLVTGGAQRLGAVLCEVFAQAGWRVLCHYHRSAAAAQDLQQRLRAQGAEVELIQADLACAQQRHRLMQQAHSRMGPLQALVNSASLFEPDTGSSFALEQARQQLEVNLLAPIDLARLMAQQHGTAAPSSAASITPDTPSNTQSDIQPDTPSTALPTGAQPAPPDAAAGTPCVVHVLDQKVYNLNPDYFSYTISKLALERAVALQAQALAPAVRVCGIAPGLMLISGPQTADNFAAARHANLLRRPLEPLHVAQACLFMCSNPAITGSTLCVDNGQHLIPLPRDILFVVDDLLARHLGTGRGDAVT